MSKDTFYFSHDYNARNDSKKKKLLAKHGYLGYGLFWAIIEDLYNNANALPTDYESIAFDLRITPEVVKSIINDFELFCIDGDEFGSSSVERRLNERNEKSVKARESAQKRWEKKNELNIGLDFTVANKRLSGSLEYYIRKSEDLLWEFQVSVPPYLYPYLFTNVGTISNRGVELTLNGVVMKKSAFQWTSTFTASHNKNVLDKITNDEFTQSSYETAFIGGTIGVWTQRIQEGEELGTFYGPVWLGVSEEGYDEFKNQNQIKNKEN